MSSDSVAFYRFTIPFPAHEVNDRVLYGHNAAMV